MPAAKLAERMIARVELARDALANVRAFTAGAGRMLVHESGKSVRPERADWFVGVALPRTVLRGRVPHPFLRAHRVDPQQIQTVATWTVADARAAELAVELAARAGFSSGPVPDGADGSRILYVFLKTVVTEPAGRFRAG